MGRSLNSSRQNLGKTRAVFRIRGAPYNVVTLFSLYKIGRVPRDNHQVESCLAQFDTRGNFVIVLQHWRSSRTVCDLCGGLKWRVWRWWTRLLVIALSGHGSVQGGWACLIAQTKPIVLGGRKAETKSKKLAHLAYLNQNSLKIQQGLKLRVCFSKVDKSWVGVFNWALPLWQFSPFFTTTIVLSKVFCLSNLSQSVLLPVDICDQSQDNNGFQTRRFRRFYEC